MSLNQLKYDQLETGSIYPITASYAISSSAGSGGTTLITGSLYPITSSWATNSISSSYSLNSTTSSYSNTSTSASYSRNSSTASYLDPISQSLIPSTGSIYSLGSPTNKWKDLYVSTGSIYIGETVLSTSGSTLFANESPVVTLNTASGQIEIIGITASLSASYATISVSSSFATTSSYNLNSISSSYALTASFTLNSAGGTTLTTGSTYPITSSWSNNAISSSYSNFASTATSANSATSASYALTASFALNNSGGGSGTITGSANYISKFTSGTAVGNSVIYESGSNIGIGTTVPNSKLNINSSGSLVSGSVVFSVEGTQGSLFSVDDNLSGSLMSVNDVSGLPILEVFSDDRLVVGTYNSNALVVTGSRVGIGTSVPVAKLQVSGNISASSFTSSVSSGVGFLGTSSFSLNTSNAITASYASNALTASYALNAASGGGGSGTVTGSTNYISKFTSGTSIGNSVIYETGSNIGIGTTIPNSKLNINSSGSLVSGSVVFSVEGTQGSLFSVDDNLSGSLMSVNDVSGLPILEVFSDDRLVVGTYNSNALVVTGSRVGIGTNNPIAKLQVNGNISGSSFTGSVFGTSSWATNTLTASFASTASYNLNSISSSFAVTSSYNLNSISSSYALTASFSLNGGGGGTTLTTGSTYPITSSWSNNATTASYALNASGGGGSISYITGSPVVGQYIVVSGSGTTQYTLTQSVNNPAHLLVSVNGVVQNYSSSYTVTGSTLNFYQPYSDGDEIDVRFLNGNTTLQTGSIANQTILYNFSSSQESTLTGLNLTGNKWGVTVVEEWNSGSGDIYYPSCSLLCHFDSVNSFGNFIDNSRNNFAITSSGNAKLSVSQYKFGGASAYFDGTGDYLVLNTSVGNLGTVDWTIECWWKSEGTSGNQSMLIGKFPSGTNNAWGLKNRFTSDILSFAYYNSGFVDVNTSVNPNDGLWHHIAASRTGTTLRLFMDGTLATTHTLPTSFNFGSGITTGSTIAYNPNDNSYASGYIDDMRVTVGFCRYTASFSVPTSAFPNSATQIATKYIGLVGGLNDSNVDYGIEKLSDTSLKIKKLTDTQQPSGSFLSSSVDRVYVNVLSYDNISISGSITNAVTSSYAVTASYALNSSGGSTVDIISPFLLAGM